MAQIKMDVAAGLSWYWRWQWFLEARWSWWQCLDTNSRNFRKLFRSLPMVAPEQTGVYISYVPVGASGGRIFD